MKKHKNNMPRVFVLGTRGFPDIQGGVETHCEQLYPRLTGLGFDVVVARRKCYLKADSPKEWKGVRFADIYAPRSKKFEAIVHSVLAVLKAKRMGADIVHIHAIGPWLVAPLAKMLGLKVVCTHHGSDYRRQKWGKMAKKMLMTGEKFGAKSADKIIVISTEIANTLRELYGRTDTDLIYNGVPKPTLDHDTDYLQQLGVEPSKYLLAVGRFVPEKNFHQLITAFRQAAVPAYKLVIAGDADHADEYSEKLKKEAAEASVVLTGFIKGKPLQQLLSHAKLFCLPSSHEGLPISLLEAMSYGRDVLVSGIEANRLAELEDNDIFELDDDATNLTRALQRKLAAPYTNFRTYDMRHYDWDNIAQQTAELYNSVLAR